MNHRELLKDKKKIVIKIGSSSLIHAETGGVDFRKLLREQSGEAVLLRALQEAIYHKPQGHAFEICPANFQMSEVGG